MAKERQLKFRDSRPDLDAYLEYIGQNRHPLVFVLDNLSNKRNIASIFRLADAARIEKVYFYQGKVDRDVHKIKRISRSTEEFVPSAYIESKEELLALSIKYQFVALEITNQSIPYYEFKFEKAIALVIGNEQKGISGELLEICEKSVHIPMMGRNTSMNVAMATGIAAYGLLEKMQLLPGKED